MKTVHIGPNDEPPRRSPPSSALRCSGNRIESDIDKARAIVAASKAI